MKHGLVLSSILVFLLAATVSLSTTIPKVEAASQPQSTHADKPVGYEFVHLPAGGGVVEFEIGKYDVTVAQFRKFVDATGYKTDAEKIGWSTGFSGRDPGRPSGLNWKHSSSVEDKAQDTHPVVNISWRDAKAFCTWIGGRLPTDEEWEHAACGGLSGKKYVWGDEWPPPPHSGNFADAAANKKYGWAFIQGYDDGYADTSPVGAFKPNGYGLFDMAGNVCQWVDRYDGCGVYGCRGGSFLSYEKNDLRVDHRDGFDNPDCVIGFRVARSSKTNAIQGSHPVRGSKRGKHLRTEIPPTRLPTRAEKRVGYVLVQIPAGEIKELNQVGTRRLAVAAFELGKYDVTVAQFTQFVEATGYKTTAEKQGWSEGYHYINELEEIEGLNWRYGATLKDKARDNDPVVHVSWQDAKAFCQWIGGRLPTSEEWELAARGGLRGKKYIWGDDWPPPPGSGNFADETARRENQWTRGIIKGYDDGYANISPVGSFNPNGYGLYDMAGNVWQWVDGGDPDNPSHGCRGGSFYFMDSECLRVDCVAGGGGSTYIIGFRVARSLK